MPTWLSSSRHRNSFFTWTACGKSERYADRQTFYQFQTNETYSRPHTKSGTIFSSFGHLNNKSMAQGQNTKLQHNPQRTFSWRSKLQNVLGTDALRNINGGFQWCNKIYIVPNINSKNRYLYKNKKKKKQKLANIVKSTPYFRRFGVPTGL